MAVRKYTVETFVQLAKEIHGDKFDYSLVTEIKDCRDKVKVICPVHGVFEIEVFQHIRGKDKHPIGCVLCNRESRLLSGKDIKRIIQQNNNEDYDLSLIDDNKKYKVTDKVGIILKNKNTIIRQIRYIINKKKNKIRRQVIRKKVKCKYSVQEFIELARAVHGDKYDYSLIKEIETVISRVPIICPVHGKFNQEVRKHLDGQGCRKCGRRALGDKMFKTTDTFIKEANETHDGFYDYSKTEYVGCYDKVTITCPIHGDFQQVPYSHIQGHGCPKCNVSHKKLENSVAQFVEELGYTIIRGNRSILYDKDTKFYKEIDIYIPSLKAAIEVNGVYWHKLHEIRKPGYHIKKNKLFKENGIKLLNVCDIRWIKNETREKKRIVQFLAKQQGQRK